ncbi:MAG: hypothetical protein AB7Q42_16360 [Acidimicrobiia bacterium]
MSDPNQGPGPTGTSGSRSPWPPPSDVTPTEGLPTVEDQHPSKPWKEILTVLGIVASIAIILIAIFPFINDDDEADGNGVASGTTVLAGGETTVAAEVPVETTVDPTATAPLPSETVPVVAGPLVVAAVEASCTAPDSTDSRGNRVTFVAQNLVDGVPTSAWRCAGDGSGQSLTFTLAAPSTVTQLGAIPGFATIDPFNGDDRFVENRRVVSARWSCLAPGGVQTASAIQTFADDRQMQTTPVNGFTGCAAIRFEVTGATPAARRDFVAVAEVSIAGATP